MNRCPLTYEETDRRYSSNGLLKLDRRLTALEDLPLDSLDLRREAAKRADKMSIQGVQPKLVANLNVRKSEFEIVDSGGRYILKPQLDTYPEIPENEDVTMRMAAAAGIEAPLHGLVYAKGGDLCYMIKRFDRAGRNKKVPVEDFAQLREETRTTKYNSSMEKVAMVVETYCTFPVPEKARLFRRMIVAFLTGNEDMHLKNFSLWTTSNITQLAPAYDMVNSTIAVADPTEELALPLRGKKSNFKRDDLIDYYAVERLGMTDGAVEMILSEISDAFPRWYDLLGRCFLTEDMRIAYRQVIDRRRRILDL